MCVRIETLSFRNHIKCVLYASVWIKEEQLIVNEFGDKVGVFIPFEAISYVSRPFSR